MFYKKNTRILKVIKLPNKSYWLLEEKNSNKKKHFKIQKNTKTIWETLY